MPEARPDAYPLFLKLEFTKLIEKFGLSPAEQPAAERADFTMTVEQVTEPAQTERLLALWQSGGPGIGAGPAGPDGPLCGLPDRGGHRVTAELFFDKYQGDWNALLNALFAADVRKVSHNVKDLTRTLLENGLRAEGFVFDTALAAYLLDATAGSYDLARLFVAYFNEELPKALYLEPDAFSLLGTPPRRRPASTATPPPWTPCTAPWRKDWRSGARWTCCMRSRCPSAPCWRRWRPPDAG